MSRGERSRWTRPAEACCSARHPGGAERHGRLDVLARLRRRAAAGGNQRAPRPRHRRASTLKLAGAFDRPARVHLAVGCADRYRRGCRRAALVAAGSGVGVPPQPQVGCSHCRAARRRYTVMRSVPGRVGPVNLTTPTPKEPNHGTNRDAERPLPRRAEGPVVFQRPNEQGARQVAAASHQSEAEVDAGEVAARHRQAHRDAQVTDRSPRHHGQEGTLQGHGGAGGRGRQAHHRRSSAGRPGGGMRRLSASTSA